MLDHGKEAVNILAGKKRQLLPAIGFCNSLWSDGLKSSEKPRTGLPSRINPDTLLFLGER
jgi:hypothetical protein